MRDTRAVRKKMEWVWVTRMKGKNWKLILLYKRASEWWQKSINGMKFAYKDVEDEMLKRRGTKKHFSDFLWKASNKQILRKI